MNNISILIGGKAGYGIDRSSLLIARLVSKIGYRIYIYRDYPSLIRGGHTFSIVRASEEKVTTHHDAIDVLLALDQNTFDLHKSRLKDDAIIIYDSDSVKPEGLLQGKIRSAGISLGKIVKEEGAPEIMRNTCIIGALCKVLGIDWAVLEEVIRKDLAKEADLNIKVARRSYDEAEALRALKNLGRKNLPIVTGNEAIGLGLFKGGLGTYIAYPMTPSSGILHFLAGLEKEFSIKVIHPESEISVMLMALGASYAGERAAVGTSGGGFCLMTEGLSLSGMAELPVVIVVGQRPGPSTGLPTYTAQTELSFVLHAGQGEFTRFVVAPGDAEEAYIWSNIALGISWKYQIPSIILSDKTLSEGTYSFDMETADGMLAGTGDLQPALWDRKAPYKRYADTQTGASPLAFPGDKDAIIKVDSYEHDELGITIEDAAITKKMTEKRLKKIEFLSRELERYKTVNIYGDPNSSTAFICWGSNKGVCAEVGKAMGIKVIHVVTMSPFPVRQLQEALVGVKTAIAVENNATAQLVRLMRRFGFDVDGKILRYDGRPFCANELEEEAKGMIS